MTRYPKSGKGSKWTALELKAINFEWKGDTLNDSEGLFGQVRVNRNNVVTIAFRFAFKTKGESQPKWFYCGSYPHETISKIREARDIAKAAVKAGIDPRVQKASNRIIAQNEVAQTLLAEEQRLAKVKLDLANSLTFKDLFEVWVIDGVNRSDKNIYIYQTFNKHAIPALGHISIRDLCEQDLRHLYRKIIASERIATAVELSKDIKQMLRWAEKRKPWRLLLIDGNPAELVEIKLLVPNDYRKERTRLLSNEELLKLNLAFESSANNYALASTGYAAIRPIKKEVQLVMWICLGTICRIGELLMTEWKHVDFEVRTWFIPAENVKGTKNTKQSQKVYLSDFVLSKFKQLHELTGHSEWAFPAKYKSGHVCVKSASKQIGDRQIQFKRRNKKHQMRVENNTLVLGTQKWTPHDLRRTGATIMQKLQIQRDVINLCQNHVIGTRVDRSYLLDDYAEAKRKAWYALGDELETILNNIH